MKYNFMILAIIFAGISTNVYTADSKKAADKGIKSQVVYQDFLLTVYKNPDGTHEAYTAGGLRDSVAEDLFNKKEAARSKNLSVEPTK